MKLVFLYSSYLKQALFRSGNKVIIGLRYMSKEGYYVCPKTEKGLRRPSSFYLSSPIHYPRTLPLPTPPPHHKIMFPWFQIRKCFTLTSVQFLRFPVPLSHLPLSAPSQPKTMFLLSQDSTIVPKQTILFLTFAGYSVCHF